MYRLREEPPFAVLTVEGTLSREDYRRFVPEFDRIAERRGPVPLLIDITAFEGWERGAFRDDLRFDRTHQDRLGPMAVVGRSAAAAIATRLSALFFKSEVRFFAAEEVEAARQWLAERGHAGRTDA